MIERTRISHPPVCGRSQRVPANTYKTSVRDANNANATRKNHSTGLIGFFPFLNGSRSKFLDVRQFTAAEQGESYRFFDKEKNCADDDPDQYRNLNYIP